MVLAMSSTSRSLGARRPLLKQAKKRASARITVGVTDDPVDDGEPGSTAPAPVRRRVLRQLRPLSPVDRAEDRQTYSKDYIAALKKATPSRPVDGPGGDDENDNDDDGVVVAVTDDAAAADLGDALDMLAGDQALAAADGASAIPSAEDVEAAKAQRTRLAAAGRVQAAKLAYGDESEEPDLASADSADDSDAARRRRIEVSLRPKPDKYGETRLVRDDEDIAEGFDDMVDDGRLALSGRAERAAQQQRRAAMAELIAAAPADGGSGADDDSDEERRRAFDATQVRAGRFGRRDSDSDAAEAEAAADAPPTVVAVPTLDELCAAAQATLEERRQRHNEARDKLQQLRDEQARIAEQQAYVQRQLDAVGEKYTTNGSANGLPVGRGLEGVGAPAVARDASAEDDDSG